MKRNYFFDFDNYFHILFIYLHKILALDIKIKAVLFCNVLAKSYLCNRN